MQYITEHTVGKYAELCSRQSHVVLQTADSLLHVLPQLTADSEQTFCQCSNIYVQLNYFQARFAIIGEHLAVSGDTLVVLIK
jgi:hypothetical protein